MGGRLGNVVNFGEREAPIPVCEGGAFSPPSPFPKGNLAKGGVGIWGNAR